MIFSYRFGTVEVFALTFFHHYSNELVSINKGSACIKTFKPKISTAILQFYGLPKYYSDRTL